MTDSATPSIEELLAHAGFARALARRLIADEQCAADVVQQAWLVAVERPPSAGPRLRAWLAQLIRNLAHNQQRGEARRTRHERSVASAAVTPSSAELASEIEAQQLIAAALLRVAEPYRETLLRRWYRDEKPAAIARAMGLPVKTVETRLARGLERLRATLTELKGGDGAHGWVAALLPLAATPVSLPAVGAAIGATTGALLMGTTAKVAVVVIAVAATIVGWSAFEGGEAESDAREGGVVADASPPIESSGRSAVDGALPVAARERAPAGETASTTEAADTRPQLRGRVVSDTTGQPVAGASIVAWPDHDLVVARDGQTVSDERGDFALTRPAVPFRLIVGASTFETWRRAYGRDELARLGDGVLGELRLELQHDATIVAVLRSTDGTALPARVRDVVTVVVGPGEGIEPDQVSRFLTGMKLERGGPMRPLGFIAARDGDSFRCDKAPTGLPLRVTAMLGATMLESIPVEPLALGETREVVITSDVGIVVPLRWRTKEDGAEVAVADAYLSQLAITWFGDDGESIQKPLDGQSAAGPLTLPGPGTLELRATLRGFAPAIVEQEVEDGSEVVVELAPLRRVAVRIALPDGEPYWDPPIGKEGSSPTTRYVGGHPHAFGRLLELGVGPAEAAPPRTIDDVSGDPNCGHPTLAKRKGQLGIDGFEVFLQHEPATLAVYADGELVGSTVVDETCEEADIEVAIAPLTTGGLSFRLIDRATGIACPSYRFDLIRLIGPPPGRTAQLSHYEVDDPIDGRFSWDRLQAGRYRIEFRESRFSEGPPILQREVVIEAGRDIELDPILR